MTNDESNTTTENDTTTPEEEKPEILSRRITPLPVELTQDDFVEIARAKARKEKLIAQLETDKSDSSKAYDKRIKEAEKDVERMGEELDSGKREMPIEVIEIFAKSVDGSRPAMIETIRTDNGKVVDRRAPTLGEMQRHLPHVDQRPGGPSVLGDMSPTDVMDEAAAAARDEEDEESGEPFSPDWSEGEGDSNEASADEAALKEALHEDGFEDVEEATHSRRAAAAKDKEEEKRIDDISKAKAKKNAKKPSGGKKKR